MILNTKTLLCQLIIVVSIGFYTNEASAQLRKNYFQQDVSYNIEAEMITHNELKASSKFNYKNNSNTSIDTIFFNLWLNAFSNKQSPYSKQMLSASIRDFYFYDPDEMGGYNNISASTATNQLTIEYLDISKEMAFVTLPETLEPGDEVTIDLDFHVTFPKLSGRTGWDEDMIKIVHWYPRVALFDQEGWHPIPYLGWGEFNGEFCDFKVSIKSDLYDIIGHNQKNDGNKPVLTLSNVVDIPFVGYITDFQKTIRGDKVKIASYNYYEDEIWENAGDYAQDIIKFFEKEIGPFPFDQLNIVQGPSYLSSAMEYPGFIIINNVSDERELDYYLAHEIAHQYFYAALGFNEREEPYMDEGLSTFYEEKYTQHKYGKSYYNDQIPNLLASDDNTLLTQKGYIHQCKHHLNQSLSTNPHDISGINYGLNNYPNASYVWRLVEQYMGKDNFKATMRSYFQSRKQQHVNRKDMLSYFRIKGGFPLDFFYGIVHNHPNDFRFESKDDNLILISTSTTPTPVIVRESKGDSLIDHLMVVRGGRLPLGDKSLAKAIIDPYYSYNDPNRNNNHLSLLQKPSFNILGKVDNIHKYDVNILPFFIINSTNNFSPSVAIYNSTFPSSNFKWLAQPAYSFSTKSLIGESWISYDWRPFKKKEHILKPIISVKTYDYQHNSKFDYDLSYLRLKGSIQYIIKDRSNPRLTKVLDINYTNISEKKASFSSEGIFTGLNNISFDRIGLYYTSGNNNALTPSTFQVNLQYVPNYNDGEHFIKSEIVFDQKYYYSAKKSFDIRLWGSYFIDNTKRSSLSYNNQLVRGSLPLSYQAFNDYAYDHYFFDRNSNINNQSLTQGGGFKYVFNGKRNLGQSNDLAFSANLLTDAPIINSSLIPLHLYFDIGGYSQYSLAGDREIDILYSGGLSLIYLDGAIKLNIPFINSSAIDNIYKEEDSSFFERISFEINFKKMNPWDFIDNINSNL